MEIIIMVKSMRNLIFSLIIIIILFFLSLYVKDNTIYTFNEIENGNLYLLDYENENLNTNNFKLKIGPITGYYYKINKIYPKYFNEKEYYSYDFKNIDEDLNDLKTEYISNLKKNYNYNEIDKVNEVGIDIKAIELYTTKDALTVLKNKFPKVKIISLDKKSKKI